MFAANFDYHRATSVSEARELLATHPGATVVAGGHSLIPAMKLRLAAPAALVDIGRVDELRGIDVDAGTLRIGALTTHAELAASDEVRRHAPALAEAAGQIGDPAVRNRGTIGGNVAHADPASDLPTVLVALGAACRVTGADGERTIAADDFFVGMMTTALAAGELLVGIDVPVRSDGQGMAYAKFTHPASRYAVIGAAARVTVSGGSCADTGVAVGGLVPSPRRVASVEAALDGQPATEDALATAAGAVAGDLGDDLIGDLFASAEYRKAVAHVYVRRALQAAAERAAQG